MDITDLNLIQMLLYNSRTPYRDLADRLGLSVNAVHKRIQGLIDSGVIHSFTARVSLGAMNGLTVIVFGATEGRVEEAVDGLRNDGRVYWVSEASGGNLYIGGYLHNIHELDPFLSTVRRAAAMPSPIVGILSGLPSSPREKELSTLDLRIINALSKDARRNLTEVAEELNTSAKTVRRRLNRMIDDGLIELSLEWYPDASNDIITMYHLQLSPETERGPLGISLLSKYAPNSLFFYMFSNLPDQLVYCAWSSTTKELDELRKKLDHEPGVRRCVPYILHHGEVFMTWRDRITEEITSSKR